jgi:hypothetical protein
MTSTEDPRSNGGAGRRNQVLAGLCVSTARRPAPSDQSRHAA